LIKSHLVVRLESFFRNYARDSRVSRPRERAAGLGRAAAPESESVAVMLAAAGAAGPVLAAAGAADPVLAAAGRPQISRYFP